MVEVLFLTKHLGRIVGGSTMTHQHQVMMDLSGTYGSLIMATQIWAWWKVQEVLNLKLKKVEDVRSRNKKLVDPRLTETPQSGYKTHQIHPPRPIEPTNHKHPQQNHLHPWPRSRGLPGLTLIKYVCTVPRSRRRLTTPPPNQYHYHKHLGNWLRKSRWAR